MDNKKILLEAAIDESSLNDIQKQLLKKKFKIDLDVGSVDKIMAAGESLDYISKKIGNIMTLMSAKKLFIDNGKSQKRFCPLWG